MWNDILGVLLHDDQCATEQHTDQDHLQQIDDNFFVRFPE